MESNVENVFEQTQTDGDHGERKDLDRRPPVRGNACMHAPPSEVASLFQLLTYG